MTSLAHKTPAASRGEMQRVADLLGGDKVFDGPITSPLEAHRVIEQGMPGAALRHLMGHLVTLRDPDTLQKAVGVSLRTIQRRKGEPSKLLSQDQGSRAWKFAEILSKATSVFGSQQAAETWLESPAIALDQRRPVDLLSTTAGAGLVEDLLGRLEYGVYA